MEYSFWIPDFNRAKNYEEKYPLTARIFEHPTAIWLTGSSKCYKTVERSIQRTINRASPDLPIFVVYAIPNRDLGQYSKGGLTNSEYIGFCKRIASGIGDNKVILIFEPDAMPHLSDMDVADAKERMLVMKQALGVLGTSSALIYVDVGHSNWHRPSDVAVQLSEFAENNIKGFSINVSNFRTTKEAIAWGNEVSKLLDNTLTYVIDTSRNGVGPLDNYWCNPPERALGLPPTTYTSSRQCDAYLWIKIPGESDGTGCGGPVAGKFWAEYAETLVRNSPYVSNS